LQEEITADMNEQIIIVYGICVLTWKLIKWRTDDQIEFHLDVDFVQELSVLLNCTKYSAASPADKLTLRNNWMNYKTTSQKIIFACYVTRKTLVKYLVPQFIGSLFSCTATCVIFIVLSGKTIVNDNWEGCGSGHCLF